MTSCKLLLSRVKMDGMAGAAVSLEAENEGPTMHASGLTLLHTSFIETTHMAQ